ncbi:MAG: endoglucanase [Bacillota bacterium]|jgi:endoglucanase|nr:endoglucanase [Bacillota bacterium]
MMISDTGVSTATGNKRGKRTETASSKGLPGRKRRGLLFLLLPVALAGLYGGYFIYNLMFQDVRFVSQLDPGFNLGNTLDSHGLNDRLAAPEQYETYWGNPYTTKEMVDSIKRAGFQTLRVPVTWYEHMDENYEIDPSWMDRVQQVVDYGIANEMYVILNAHHDSWYTPAAGNAEKAEEITRKLWQQIAVRFQDYDEKLLFESMNEPRLIGTAEEWYAGTPEARKIVNRLNTVFAETVRSSGGRNQDRYLMLPTYCASTLPEALSDFQMPKGERMIVSVHLYRPYEFTLAENRTAKWTSKKEQTEEIDQAFRDIKRIFHRRGVPVIIGEYGALDKNNEDSRAAWVKYVRKLAGEQEIPCIWWDNSVFNRKELQWNYPELVKALVS